MSIEAPKFPKYEDEQKKMIEERTKLVDANPKLKEIEKLAEEIRYVGGMHNEGEEEVWDLYPDHPRMKPLVKEFETLVQALSPEEKKIYDKYINGY